MKKKYFCMARIRRTIEASSWIEAKNKLNEEIRKAYSHGSLNPTIKLITKRGKITRK
jgi:hypothetical protein